MHDIFNNELNIGDEVAFNVYKIPQMVTGKVIQSPKPRKGKILIEYNLWNNSPEYVFKSPMSVVKRIPQKNNL